MESRHQRAGCRSARWIDGLFGQTADPAEYRTVSGNVAPSMLWSQYDGFKPKLRFRVGLPLPAINQRWRAFIGRVDREEFVTERAEQSGTLPRQFGTIGEEQTLLGLGYSPLGDEGHRFDLGAGIHISAPLDPYVKASYRLYWALDPDRAFQIRPTVFWERSERLGMTLRTDYDHAFPSGLWYGRVTASGTVSGRAKGLRGYATATLFRKLSDRSAMAFQAGVDGETGLDVPLHAFGVRASYRQNVWRDWLVMELRTNLTWPRRYVDEPRKPSWGGGIGFEMVFGPGRFRGID